MDSSATAWLLALGITLLLIGNALFHAIIFKTNKKLPAEKKLSHVFIHPLKAPKVFKEYKIAYPSGYLHIFATATTVTGVILGFMALQRL